MQRKFLLATWLCLLMPATALAAPWQMKVQLTLAPLPGILMIGTFLWGFVALLWALSKVWRIVRGPTKEGHLDRGQAAARALQLIIWGILPQVLVSFLGNRDYVADKLPSLWISLIWAFLMLPALLVRPEHQQAKKIRFVSVAIADLVGCGLVIWQVLGRRLELEIWPLLILVVVLHLIAVLNLMAHKTHWLITRWVLFFTLLFFCSAFIVPPAITAERVAHTHGPVLAVPQIDREIIGAGLQKGGKTAVVAFADEPKLLYQVTLADGDAQKLFTANTQKFTLLAADPEHSTLAGASYIGHSFQIYTFQLSPVSLGNMYDEGSHFEPRALAVSDKYILTGGKGKEVNLRLCPVQNQTDYKLLRIPEVCRDLRLPMHQIGQILIGPESKIAIVAEGDENYLDGWRLININLYNGNIIRMEHVGRTLGGMAYWPEKFSFFLARPAQGVVELRLARNLKLYDNFPVEKGVRHLRFDNERKWLLATSEYTGNFLVIDVNTKTILARAPIGRDVLSLDYDAETTTALLVTKKKLVTIQIEELLGFPEFRTQR